MKNGWTLTETIIVVAIISMLGAIAVPSFMKAKEKKELLKKVEKVSTVEKDRAGVIYTVVKIDGCEYIDNATAAGHHVYTHKGNCLNSFHLIK